MNAQQFARPARGYHLSAATTRHINRSTQRRRPFLCAPVASASSSTTTMRFLSADSGFHIVESNAPMARIPDAPVIPPTTADLSETLTDVAAATISAAGETPFAQLGLGGWTPVGLVQNCMEYLHVGLDIPWWGAIMIGTICVRTLILPLVVMSQRNAAKMSNNMPQIQCLQLKMTEARQAGNSIESARYAQEMMMFMKEKNLNPLKNMIVPLAQAPLFISFFIGLRQMANVPVESLRDGGLWWFADLTMPDQFFLLPIITSATLYLTIELGTDGAKLAAQNMQTMKYVLRAMPVIIFPFTMNFPGLILCYWACSNFISLVQVSAK